MKMRGAGLTVASVVLTTLVLGNAYYNKKQFYPSVVYITKSNSSMGVIYFQALMLVYLTGKLMRKIFFGELRAAEFEHLMERSWYAITETCLAFTVFRDDFTPKFVALFTLLLFLKTFHWLAEDRVDFMERSPIISVLFHVRVVSLLFLLGALDLLSINHAYLSTVTKGASVQLVFGFEYAILATIIINITIKYILHTIDLHSETPWENKAVFLLYTELVMGFFKVLLYVTFVAIMIRIYTLPLFAFRPMYHTMRKFKQAYNDVILSRRAIQNMNTLYPDATAEELAAADNVCIICREEMTTASKKLPCNHIFHTACLRSWFQRQQTCPTCRLNILRAPQAPAATPPPQAAQPPPPPPRVFPFWTPPPAAAQGGGAQAGPSGARATPPRFMAPPLPPPFMMGMFPPPPMPPPDFAGFTDEELARMEGDARANIEARLNSLRQIELLVNATTTVMSQYMSVAPITARTASPPQPATNGSSGSNVTDQTGERSEPGNEASSSSGPSAESVGEAAPDSGPAASASSSDVSNATTEDTEGGQDSNNPTNSQQADIRRLRMQRFGLDN